MLTTQYGSVDHQALKLRHGFSLNDLYNRDGLIRLDAAFLDYLGVSDAALRTLLETARLAGGMFASKKEESALLIALAPHLEDFSALIWYRSAGAVPGCQPS